MAENTYKGTVEKQTQGGTSIIISGKQYLIDYKTIVHGIVRQGETAPIFDIGSELSFKLSKTNMKDVQYISEIWMTK